MINYPINWVAGTKLILILLLIVIIYAADQQTLLLGGVTLAISISSFFWRLFPLIRKMDWDSQIKPQKYSTVLGWMIFAFVRVFLAATVVSYSG